MRENRGLVCNLAGDKVMRKNVMNRVLNTIRKKSFFFLKNWFERIVAVSGLALRGPHAVFSLIKRLEYYGSFRNLTSWQKRPLKSKCVCLWLIYVTFSLPCPFARHVIQLVLTFAIIWSQCWLLCVTCQQPIGFQSKTLICLFHLTQPKKLLINLLLFLLSIIALHYNMS